MEMADMDQVSLQHIYTGCTGNGFSRKYIQEQNTCVYTTLIA